MKVRGGPCVVVELRCAALRVASPLFFFSVLFFPALLPRFAAHAFPPLHLVFGSWWPSEASYFPMVWALAAVTHRPLFPPVLFFHLAAAHRA